MPSITTDHTFLAATIIECRSDGTYDVKYSYDRTIRKGLSGTEIRNHIPKAPPKVEVPWIRGPA